MNVRKRLGELLIEAGVIDAAQLQTALAHQRKAGGKLGQALVDLRLATEPQIVAALSRKLGYDVVDVAGLARTPDLEQALRLVPAEVAARHTVLPVAADAATLTVVMSDPSNIAIVDELSFRTGRRLRIALAGDRVLTAAIERLYGADDDHRRGVAHRAVIAPPGTAPRAAPSPTPAPASQPAATAVPDRRPPTPREAALLEALQRALRGDETALVKPAQLAAAAVRLLVRKGLVTEAELVAELAKG
jgi:hypothetical protein